MWSIGGAGLGQAGGAPLLTQHEYVLKTTTYQNNNSEGWSLSWVTCDIPGELAPDAELYDVMMIAFYQDVAKLESEDSFSLQRRSSLSLQQTDFGEVLCVWLI